MCSFEQASEMEEVKKYLQEHRTIVINVSGHSGYHTTYQYVTKQDTQVLRSENHPAAIAFPKTSSAIQNRSSHKKGKGAQEKWLSNVEVSNIIVSHSIDSKLHLLALAKKRKTNGDSRLYECVWNKGEKRVNELMQSVWSLKRAQQTLDRRSMSRTDLLKKAYNNTCVCQGEWLQCAKQSLCNNGIQRSIFADAVITLFAMGRWKGRNIYITGPANCGKTFILDPLRVIYNTFLSPVTCSYAWLGVEDKEGILLNDVPYTPAILTWNDMLLLLKATSSIPLCLKPSMLGVLRLPATLQFLPCQSLP